MFLYGLSLSFSLGGTTWDFGFWTDPRSQHAYGSVGRSVAGLPKDRQKIKQMQAVCTDRYSCGTLRSSNTTTSSALHRPPVRDGVILIGVEQEVARIFVHVEVSISHDGQTSIEIVNRLKVDSLEDKV